MNDLTRLRIGPTQITHISHFMSKNGPPDHPPHHAALILQLNT